MKYPQQQFSKLVEILKELNKYITNLKDINFSHLHYIAYQQVSLGQQHNRFVLLNDGTIITQHIAVSLNKEYKPLFETDDTFELYPNNTNDNHIETAIKRVLKEI